MALGTMTGVLNRIPTQQGRPPVAELVLSCLADTDGSGAHIIPVTEIVALTIALGFDIRGLKLYSIAQKPGTTGPTDHSDLTITDKYGIDLMAGNGTDFIRNAVASRYMLDPALAFIITGDITVTIINNSVSGALLTLALELIGC